MVILTQNPWEKLSHNLIEGAVSQWMAISKQSSLCDAITSHAERTGDVGSLHSSSTYALDLRRASAHLEP